MRFEPELAERAGTPGVAVGLAWTPAGGDILFIESTRMPGKGKLRLTGSLGDVMRESAEAARTWLRARAGDLRIDATALRDARTSTCTCRRARCPRTGPRRASRW